MRNQLLSIVAVAALLSGCTSIPSATPSTTSVSTDASRAGTVVSFDLIDQLDQATLQATASELPGAITVQNGVRLYRLVYRSQVRGQPINASALVAIPNTQTANKGLVLYLKGSDIPRNSAPTTPNAIWTTEAAVYSGNNFITILPDYIGFGASPSPQAFLLSEENVADFRAALTAAHEALSLRGRTPLFITGFSQGAHHSAALHRDLEARPMAAYNLRATVAVAGPHELTQLFQRRMFGPLATDPMAMSYVAWASYTFAWYEGRPLEEVFIPAYADKVADWFGGSMTVQEITPQLPHNVTDMFQPAFLETVRSDENFWFNRYIRASETDKWVPARPFRVVIGGADEIVDPESTRSLYDHAQTRVGTMSKLEMPGLNHQQTGDAAFASTLAWFTSIPTR
jgi:uncharacterized protein YceK